MVNELDDIRASADCPVCGRVLNVTYRTLRLGRTIECQGCGETIKLEDDTKIGAVQKLINETGDENG
jgi:peptide subunit release factor 1 (eRF1)